MAIALKENYLLHKLHSLTGIVPVGYYMAQHLVLNTFSLGGEAQFNKVIDFFGSLPKHVLFAMEMGFIWIPLIFHAVYGVFIAMRAQNNFIGTKYGWSQNRMFLLQRISGILIIAFLGFHTYDTYLRKLTGGEHLVKFAAMQERFLANGGLTLYIYALGILVCAYHLGYGVWNFCIRWGITISEEAQLRVQKLSVLVFLGLTLVGWGALVGFVINKPAPAPAETVQIVAPTVQASLVR